MQNKTINELTSLENPRLTDTLPIWDGTEGKTKKVSLAKIPANVITPVDSLPESPNILDRVYRYNNKYYVGNESAQTLTELASKADIPTVVDTVADGNMNPVTSNAVYDAISTIGKNSYAETKTGETWIDGKPIYRKVANGTIPSTIDSVTGWTSPIIIAIPNLDSIISLRFAGCEYESINGMAEYVSDDSKQFKCFLYHDDIYIKTNVSSALSSSFNLIMEYTKTTD